MRGLLGADPNSLAALATISAAAMTGLVTWALGRRSQSQKGAQNAYDQLWRLFEERKNEIANLKLELAADKKECQDEIAALRRQHDAEIADIRRECEARVAEETRRSHAEVKEIEHKLEVRIENYRRDRDYWKAKAQGELNGRDDDYHTPPPENRR